MILSADFSVAALVMASGAAALKDGGICLEIGKRIWSQGSCQFIAWKKSLVLLFGSKGRDTHVVSKNSFHHGGFQILILRCSSLCFGGMRKNSGEPSRFLSCGHDGPGIYSQGPTLTYSPRISEQWCTEGCSSGRPT